jgi:hypothetical protein
MRPLPRTRATLISRYALRRNAERPTRPCDAATSPSCFRKRTADAQLDDQSALVVLRNPAAGAQNRMKYVDIAFHFARYRVLMKDVTVSYVPTVDMVADLLTKQLPGPGHAKNRTSMGLASILAMG